MDTIKTFELFECQQVLLQIDGLLTYDAEILYIKRVTKLAEQRQAP